MKELLCTKCNNTLPISEFKKYSKKTNGRNYHEFCRDCEDSSLLEENWKEGLLKCHICNEFLPVEHFQNHKNYEYRGFRDKRCKSCKNIQNKKARETYTDEEKLNKILLVRYHEALKRSKTKNIEFNLDIEFLKELFYSQKSKCAISEINLTYELDSGRTNTNLSIDRKDSSKGYTKDNVQLVCMVINQMKSDLDMDTLYYLCEQILTNKK